MRKIFAVVSLAVMLAGCASGVSGHGSAAVAAKFPASSPASSPAPVGPSSASPSTGFRMPSASTWRRETDSTTGIGFDLPGTVASPEIQNVQTTNGVAVQERIYQVIVGGSDGAGISVGVIGTDKSHVVLDLDTYPQKFRDQFTKAGATDAAATEIKQITVQGHHGIDFRISFTAKDGRGRHAVWLLRVVHDGVFFVVAQTIDFDTNVAAVLPGVRATQARLVAGLKLV